MGPSAIIEGCAESSAALEVCRDAAKISETRPATLTDLGRVAEVRQSRCAGVGAEAGTLRDGVSHYCRAGVSHGDTGGPGNVEQMVQTAPMQKQPSMGETIAVALAGMWCGGTGPSQTALTSTFAIVGVQSEESDTKENRVMKALSTSPDDATTQRLISELVELLRCEGSSNPTATWQAAASGRSKSPWKASAPTYQHPVTCTGATTTPE